MEVSARGGPEIELRKGLQALLVYRHMRAVLKAIPPDSVGLEGWMLQMQLVDRAHERQVRFAGRPRQVAKTGRCRAAAGRRTRGGREVRSSLDS
jgi:hypothetical protein